MTLLSVFKPKKKKAKKAVKMKTQINFNRHSYQLCIHASTYRVYARKNE